VKEVSVDKSAFATSIVNMLNMAFGSLAIFVVGLIMQANWDGTIQNEVPIYSNFAYQMGFGTLLVGLVIGTLGIWLTKTKSDIKKN
jgi:uncharacterized membrane protein YedE/YeeE